MKLTKEQFLALKPCQKSIDYVNQFSTLAEAIEKCTDIGWAYWLLDKQKLLTKANTDSVLALIIAFTKTYDKDGSVLARSKTRLQQKALDNPYNYSYNYGYGYDYSYSYGYDYDFGYSYGYDYDFGYRQALKEQMPTFLKQVFLPLL